jgi:uncharacterized membrane protein YidH (DUF202 family)
MDGISMTDLLNKINAVLLNPLITLLFFLAAAIFILGLVRFLANPDSTEARETAKKHMLYGIIGITIMISVYGIIAFLLSNLGIDNPEYLRR